MICPICRAAALTRTDFTVDLPDALKRWEEYGNFAFPADVVAHYSDPNQRTVTLYRCHICDFGRFEPVCVGTAAFYDVIEKDYYVPDKWEFGEAIKDIRAAGGRRVLDVGCGMGHFLDMLRAAEPALDLNGHDISELQLEPLKVRGFGTLHGEAAAIASRKDSIEPFDAICIFQTIEHVEDPVEFIAAFRQILRPRGLLIVTAPDAAGPVFRHYPDSHTAVPPHHVTLWTARTFQLGLPEMGFDVEMVRHEPLEDYLWPYYLNPMWPERIWPAAVFSPLALRIGRAHPDEHYQLAMKTLTDFAVRRLHGVQGHTVYVLARRSE